MLKPGNVIRFWSDEAGKQKYHLCVCTDGLFLFLNTPKKRTYTSDLIVPCSEFPFLEATDSGNSTISCSLVTKKTLKELTALKAVVVGKASNGLLQRLFEFIEDSPVLAEEDRENLIAGLGDWL